MIEQRNILAKSNQSANKGTLDFNFTGQFWHSSEILQEKIIAHLGIVIWIFYYSINNLEHGSNSCATSNLQGQKTKFGDMTYS